MRAWTGVSAARRSFYLDVVALDGGSKSDLFTYNSSLLPFLRRLDPNRLIIPHGTPTVPEWPNSCGPMNHALRQRRRMGGLLFDCIAARSSNRQLCCNERPARFVQDLSLRDHSLGNPALPTDMNSLDQSTICLDILQRTSNQHYQQPTTVTSLAHRTRDPTPIDRDRFQSNRTAHPADPTQILPGKIPGKFGQVPTASNLLLPHHHHPLINQYNPCRGSSIGRACGSY